MLLGLNRYLQAARIEDMEAYKCHATTRSISFDDPAEPHAFTVFKQKLQEFVDNACTFVDTIPRFATPRNGMRGDAAGEACFSSRRLILACSLHGCLSLPPSRSLSVHSPPSGPAAANTTPRAALACAPATQGAAARRG